MKMNRTEWIVVILCVLALPFAMTFTRTPAPPQPSQPAAAAETPSTPAAAPATPEAAPAPAEQPAVPVQETVLENAAARYTFTSAGGGIKEVTILAGPFAGRTEQVLNRHAPAAIGALSRAPGDLDTTVYQIKEQTDRSITYTGVSNGLEITKTWTMAEGDAQAGWGYVWKLNVTFKNARQEKVLGDYFLYAGALGPLHANDWLPPAVSWYADGDAEEHAVSRFDRSTFLGLWQTRPATTQIVDSLQNVTWGGVHNQYYANIISPAAPRSGDTATPMWSKPLPVEFDDPGRGTVKGRAVQSALGIASLQLEPGASVSWEGEIFTGPRSGTVLNKIGGERRQAMHYGMFRSLSRLFLGLLNNFYSWVNSYGVAVMMLTLLVRVCIWPLHIKSTRAMKRMAKLSPMMHDLKEKYKDDPQRMNMEMMKLYRDYGVNPVGGCLPLLLQFPIFLGYYGMMRTAVEMRGHEFLWVKDLSMPDTVAHIAGFPINPLPLVMAVTMYVQMAVTPKPAESNPQIEMQQKIFKIMPLFFLLFCYNFASALALYWSVQNIISIGQTWAMKFQPEPELKKLPPRPSFMQRMMEAQRLAQEAQRRQGKSGPARPGGGRGIRRGKDS